MAQLSYIINEMVLEDKNYLEILKEIFAGSESMSKALEDNNIALPDSSDQMQCQDGFLDTITDKEADVLLSIFKTEEFQTALASY